MFKRRITRESRHASRLQTEHRSYADTNNIARNYINVFVNSKSVAIMAGSNSKRAFWSNGSNYAGYREYTIYKLLEALELILFNTYIQFTGSIFK